MIGVARYQMTGIARWEDYSRGINWGVIPDLFDDIGSPACGMVYSSGDLRRADFIKAGWRMNAVSLGLLLLIALGYWRFLALPGGRS